MAKAIQIAQRIKGLEADVRAQREIIAEAEKAVAAAFVDGANPAKALATLAGEKDTLLGQIGALSMLDAQWYETARNEYNVAYKAVNDRTDAAYLEASGALEKAITQHVEPIIRKFGIRSDYLVDFTDNVKSATWSIFSARGADQLREIGSAPKEPSPRNADGNPVNGAA